MDWCAPGVDLNLFANKHRSSKSAPVSATGEIGTQTYDKSKGKVDQGTDKRWTSTNGDAEYALSDIGPPQIGTISMKDGILFVQGHHGNSNLRIDLSKYAYATKVIISDCIQSYVRILGPSPDLYLVGCRQLTVLCEPRRIVEAADCQNVALVLQGESLRRVHVVDSRLLSVYAHIDAIREPIETENSFAVALFAIFEAPNQATAEDLYDLRLFSEQVDLLDGSGRLQRSPTGWHRYQHQLRISGIGLVLRVVDPPNRPTNAAPVSGAPPASAPPDPPPATAASRRMTIADIVFADGRPRHNTGLRVGDVLKEVDGVDVTDLSLDDVQRRTAGPVGSWVTLLVERWTNNIAQRHSVPMQRGAHNVPADAVSLDLQISEYHRLYPSDIFFVHERPPAPAPAPAPKPAITPAPPAPAPPAPATQPPATDSVPAIVNQPPPAAFGKLVAAPPAPASTSAAPAPAASAPAPAGVAGLRVLEPGPVPVQPAGPVPVQPAGPVPVQPAMPVMTPLAREVAAASAAPAAPGARKTPSVISVTVVEGRGFLLPSDAKARPEARPEPGRPARISLSLEAPRYVTQSGMTKECGGDRPVWTELFYFTAQEESLPNAYITCQAVRTVELTAQGTEITEFVGSVRKLQVAQLLKGPNSDAANDENGGWQMEGWFDLEAPGVARPAKYKPQVKLIIGITKPGVFDPSKFVTVGSPAAGPPGQSYQTLGGTRSQPMTIPAHPGPAQPGPAQPDSFQLVQASSGPTQLGQAQPTAQPAAQPSQALLGRAQLVQSQTVKTQQAAAAAAGVVPPGQAKAAPMRPPELAVSSIVMTNTSSIVTWREVELVRRICKPPNLTGKDGPAGLGLRKMFKHGPMVIQAVDDKGPAMGRVLVGYELHAVDGRAVYGMSSAEVDALLSGPSSAGTAGTAGKEGKAGAPAGKEGKAGAPAGKESKVGTTVRLTVGPRSTLPPEVDSVLNEVRELKLFRRAGGAVGPYGSVGMLLRKDEVQGPCTVAEIDPDGPAAVTNRVRVRDEIYLVDGKKTYGMHIEQISPLVDGVPGTPVCFSILEPYVEPQTGKAAAAGGIGEPPAAARARKREEMTYRLLKDLRVLILTRDASGDVGIYLATRPAPAAAAGAASSTSAAGVTGSGSASGLKGSGQGAGAGAAGSGAAAGAAGAAAGAADGEEVLGLGPAEIEAFVTDGPAHANGRLRVGDKVHAVDGRLIYSLSVDKVAQLLRGQPGSQVIIAYAPVAPAPVIRSTLSPASGPTTQIPSVAKGPNSATVPAAK